MVLNVLPAKFIDLNDERFNMFGRKCKAKHKGTIINFLPHTLSLFCLFSLVSDKAVNKGFYVFMKFFFQNHKKYNPSMHATSLLTHFVQGLRFLDLCCFPVFRGILCTCYIVKRGSVSYITVSVCGPE